MINISNLLSDYIFDQKLRNTYILYGSAALATALTEYIQRASSDDYRLAVTYARDFLLGSDLKKIERKKFYAALKEKGFINVLVKNLNHVDRSIVYTSIYNIGKIAQAENAVYLEYAYENYYNSVEPILSYACLFEASWLGSDKYKGYLADLERSDDIVSIFTIALLFDSIPHLEVSMQTLENVSQRLFGVSNKSKEYKDSIIDWMFLFERKFDEIQIQLLDPVLVKREFERFISEFRQDKSKFLPVGEINRDEAGSSFFDNVD